MPGPLPKPAHLRQRMNRVSGAAILPNDGEARALPAKLPARRPDESAWHPWTHAWWKLLCAAPMAREYLASDLPGLIRLAVLIDTFHREPSPHIAAEIRLQEQRFGLSPLDRRKLEWSIQKTEAETAKRKLSTVDVRRADPREVLRALK